MFISEAFAQAAAPAAPGADSIFGGFSNLGGMVMPIVLIAVLYFVMFRPQMKRQKEQRAMIDALAKGDEVVIAGGMIGRIAKLGDTFLGVEVANNVEIQVQRQSVVQVLPKGTYSK